MGGGRLLWRQVSVRVYRVVSVISKWRAIAGSVQERGIEEWTTRKKPQRANRSAVGPHLPPAPPAALRVEAGNASNRSIFLLFDAYL